MPSSPRLIMAVVAAVLPTVAWAEVAVRVPTSSLTVHPRSETVVALSVELTASGGEPPTVGSAVTAWNLELALAIADWPPLSVENVRRGDLYGPGESWLVWSQSDEGGTSLLQASEVALAGDSKPLASRTTLVSFDLRLPAGVIGDLVVGLAGERFDLFDDTQPIPQAYGHVNLVAESRIPIRWWGDFDVDGILSAWDLDQLTQATFQSDPASSYDLNRDQRVDAEDRRFWVDQLRGTYFGDANLDGSFDTADLVHVLQLAEYEDGVARNSSWSSGDWNGDLEFDSSDLIAALREGGFEAGPRPAARPLPESFGGGWSTLVAWMACLSGRRTQRVTTGCLAARSSAR